MRTGIIFCIAAVMLFTLLMLARDCATPPGRKGLVVLNVDSGQRKTLPFSGQTVGSNADGSEVFLLGSGGLSKCAPLSRPVALSRLRPLQPDPAADVQDLWDVSPDASQIVYLAEDWNGGRGHIHGLWVSEMSGAGPSKQVLEYPDSRFGLPCLKWLSNDTICCALAGYVGTGRYGHCILRIGVEDGKVDVLHRGNDFGMAQFALSPDRERLAFFDDLPNTPGSTLHLLEIATGTVTVLDRRQVHAGPLVWSPDGKRLAFDDARGVWVMNVADKTLTEMNTRFGPPWVSRLFYVTNDRLVGVYYPEARATQVHVFDTDRGRRIHKFKENTFFHAVALPEQGVLVYGTD